ncbi:MAG TPA: hypothetical protein DCE41_30715, partial [Cytophagales bacterium]|nr:hypothetical protein [Cytophagales bacterium]
MKHTKYLFALLAVLSTACMDDFLIQEPITEPATELVFANQEVIELLLPGAYQPMRWEFNPVFGDSYCMSYHYTDVRSDDVVIENTFFQPHGHGFENFVDLTSNNIIVGMTWLKFFTGIARSNQIIRGLANVDSTVLDASTKNLFLGEAKFLRAFYYFEAVKNFGDVPLFGDEVVDIGVAENIMRRPVADVYAQIEADLIEAAGVLPSSRPRESEDPTQSYRATQGAAMGLLAKAYLYQEKWQAAADQAQAVIDLGVYDLETNYGDNWLLSNEHGIESIFEVGYFNDASGGSWGPGAQGSLTAQFFSPNLAAPVTGWNYNLITPELRDLFEAEGDDVRRTATVIEDGSSFESQVLTDAGLNPIPDGFTDDNLNQNDLYGQDFSYSRKYFLTPEEVTDQTAGFVLSSLNHKVMRYSEILLILAEAVANGAAGNGQ